MQGSDAVKEETKEGESASVLGKKDPDGEASRNSNRGTFRCARMRAELLVSMGKKGR